MTELEWSGEAVIAMVKAYEKLPELWRRDHSLFRVTSAKNEAWKNIARLFSCDTADVRKKFNSVLASHRRERVKEKEGGRSSWFLYPHLKFLRVKPKPLDDDQDHLNLVIGLMDDQDRTEDNRAELSLMMMMMMARGLNKEETPTEDYEEMETLESFTLSNLDSDETDIKDDQEHDMDIAIKEEPVSIQAFTRKGYRTIGNHSKKRLMRTVKKRSKQLNSQSHLHSLQVQSKEQGTYSKAYVDSRLQEWQRTIQKESVHKKDECDTYGEYIASMLRKRNKKTRCLMKQAINNILFEQEMNEYENPLGDDMVQEVVEHSDE